MQPGHNPAHLDASASVAANSSIRVGPAFTAIGTALCLLALYALLTPASFGPLGALMLLTLAAGAGKACGVPLAAIRGDHR